MDPRSQLPGLILIQPDQPITWVSDHVCTGTGTRVLIRVVYEYLNLNLSPTLPIVQYLYRSVQNKTYTGQLDIYKYKGLQEDRNGFVQA